MLIAILKVSPNKIHLKVSSAIWWPFCLCLNVLMDHIDPGHIVLDAIALKFNWFLCLICWSCWWALIEFRCSIRWLPGRCQVIMLTHWGRDQIDAISQTTFSNAFPRMKMNEFLLGFHRSLFLRFELTIPSLVQIMAWRRPGDKPLSEPMMVSLLTHICVTGPQWVNSLAPGKFDWNFTHVIFKQVLAIDGWGISCEIALMWMSLDFTDDQSTLVQVMDWCRQAPSHYLSQWWPRFLSPYRITRPQ